MTKKKKKKANPFDPRARQRRIDSTVMGSVKPKKKKKKKK
jgi:hypothetical protein